MGEHGPLPKQNTVRRNKREVSGVIPTGRPTMPTDLPVEAQREWRRIVPMLDSAGLLTILDRAILIRYVTAWADWIDINAQLAKMARLVKGADANMVRNPLWLLRRDAAAEVHTLSVQLGLSPVARIRSGMKHEPPVSRQREQPSAQMSDFAAERKRRLIDAG